MKITLLSNVTVTLIADMLGKSHSVWMPDGFGQFMQECLSPSEGLRAFSPDVIFLLLDGRELLHNGVSPAVLGPAVENLAIAFPNAWVLVSDLDVSVNSCSPLTGGLPARHLEMEWLSQLDTVESGHSNVCRFELKSLAEENGRKTFYDSRMRYAASMPFSLKGHREIVNRLNRYISAYMGKRKKVLALDLDNTLWKGVIGEDGANGIRLGPDKDGKPFTDFQQHIKELQRQGILLVCLSKNNAADVEPVWSDSRMILKKDDFVSLRMDWNDKSVNLEQVAEELNLGTDSFVFIDDNPAEREQMKIMHPEVLVPEFPKNVSDLESFICQLAEKYFLFVRTTVEDTVKTTQYRAEAARKRFAAQPGMSAGDYLRGLDIKISVHEVMDSEIARVAQLSQKTNQFNVCTNRYSEGDIRYFVESSDYRIFAVHASDRFGNQGLIAFVLIHLAENADSRAKILDWVMSCRTMNRTIEYAVEDFIESQLFSMGIIKLDAEYLQTPKNAPVAKLYDRLGFSVVDSGYSIALPSRKRVHYVEVCP